MEPSPSPVTRLRKGCAFFAILVAPFFLLAALLASPLEKNAALTLTLAGLGAFVSSVICAAILGRANGQTLEGKIGIGILCFVLLQLFYVAVTFVGCTAFVGGSYFLHGR